MSNPVLKVGCATRGSPRFMRALWRRPSSYRRVATPCRTPRAQARRSDPAGPKPGICETHAEISADLSSNEPASSAAKAENVSENIPAVALAPAPRTGVVDEGQVGVAAFARRWRETSASVKSRIIGMGVAGACTLAVCNAAYFSAAYAVTWCLILRVPTGIPAADVGIYVAEALGITYASCQATKLPRILGTLLLVPAVASLLGTKQELEGQQDPATNGAGSGRRGVLVAVIGCAVAAVLGTVATLALACMVPVL